MSNPSKKYYNYTLKDFHKEHKKLKKSQKKKSLDYHTYKDLMRDFFSEISKLIIWEQWSFVIPYKLGVIKVKSFKTSSMKGIYNYHESKKQGKKVPYTNPHTFGRVYTIKWINYHLTLRNKKYYIFNASKGSFAKKHGAGKSGLYDMLHKVAKDPLAKLYR